MIVEQSCRLIASSLKIHFESISYFQMAHYSGWCSGRLEGPSTQNDLERRAPGDPQTKRTYSWFRLPVPQHIYQIVTKVLHVPKRPIAQPRARGLQCGG